MNWLLLFVAVSALIYLQERRKHQPKAISKKSFSPEADTSKDKKKAVAESIHLTPEQSALYDVMESSQKHIFISGKAGTGKSVLLKYFKDRTSKKVVVAAPTGIAALNIGGQTIHSLFKIKPGFLEKTSHKPGDVSENLLKHIDAIVIDEISMVRADLMDEIDHQLRQVKENNSVFGGVQIIMFGDLYQLPPVLNDSELRQYFSDNYGGYFFFNALVWRKTVLDIYELSKVFRQKDNDFIRILNAIRAGRITKNTLTKLNMRTGQTLPKEGVVTLASTNKAVSQINHKRLAQLNGKEYVYKAEIEGDIRTSEYPTEEVLRLKKGAQVMLLKNDKAKRWVNGTIASIQSLSSSGILITVGKFSYSLEPTTWNKIRYSYNLASRKVEEKPSSSFIQYPLKLAWAVTIHKSQGQTYNRCAIDISGGVFAHGQTYVALSRCRSIAGLYLSAPIKEQDITVAPEVVNFMKRARPMKATYLGRA